MNVIDSPALPARSVPPPFDEAALPGPLRCPLCGEALTLDPWWSSPHWLCPSGHSYSNIRVLLQELRERGWLPADYSFGGQKAG